MTEERETRTLLRDGKLASRPPVGVVVQVLDVPAKPNRYVLSAGFCRLGSGAGSDVVINETTVSRNHAEIELGP